MIEVEAFDRCLGRRKQVGVVLNLVLGRQRHRIPNFHRLLLRNLLQQRSGAHLLFLNFDCLEDVLEATGEVASDGVGCEADGCSHGLGDASAQLQNSLVFGMLGCTPPLLKIVDNSTVNSHTFFPSRKVNELQAINF